MVAAITRTSTRLRPRVAERQDLAVLEEAEQLRLDVEGEVADLVEEQRAAAGGRTMPAKSETAPVNAPRRWPNS